jgi:hypothetical protein
MRGVDLYWEKAIERDFKLRTKIVFEETPKNLSPGAFRFLNNGEVVGTTVTTTATSKFF